MDTCAAILICEGPTDVAVVGACLEKHYGATTETLETGTLPTYRSKIVISDVCIGLLVPVKSGLEQAEKAFVAMATDRALRGLYSKLSNLCLVRDMNGHNIPELHTLFHELVNGVGNSEVQPEDKGNGKFQLGKLRLNQILMGDPRFGESGQNAVDDHVMDCLVQEDRSDLGQLSAAFEGITGGPPTSKQFVNLAMTLDEHLGNPTRYYEKVIKRAPSEWIAGFLGRIGLDDVLQEALSGS